jgi:hypothetical protein
VARFDLAIDVDQQLIDAPGALGQHVDLRLGANVAAVGQCLLDICAVGVVSGNGGRGQDRRLNRGRGGVCPLARGEDQQAGEPASQNYLFREQTTSSHQMTFHGSHDLEPQT